MRALSKYAGCEYVFVLDEHQGYHFVEDKTFQEVTYSIMSPSKEPLFETKDKMKAISTWNEGKRKSS